MDRRTGRDLRGTRRMMQTSKARVVTDRMKPSRVENRRSSPKFKKVRSIAWEKPGGGQLQAAGIIDKDWNHPSCCLQARMGDQRGRHRVRRKWSQKSFRTLPRPGKSPQVLTIQGWLTTIRNGLRGKKKVGEAARKEMLMTKGGGTWGKHLPSSERSRIRPENDPLKRLPGPVLQSKWKVTMVQKPNQEDCGRNGGGPWLEH